MELTTALIAYVPPNCQDNPINYWATALVPTPAAVACGAFGTTRSCGVHEGPQFGRKDKPGDVAASYFVHFCGRRACEPEAVRINQAEAPPSTTAEETNDFTPADFDSVAVTINGEVPYNPDMPSTSAAAALAQKKWRPKVDKCKAATR
uniref:Uncharacterized protein n=1 Tax=Glossina austeni TaxID=7395 RepID=A0A1A9UU28_GLOAU